MSFASSDSGEAVDCAVYMKALGDPVRFQIVQALRAGPHAVSDISELLEIDLANASHHLRVLFHSGLVTLRKEGKFRYYQLNPRFCRNRPPAKSLDFGCCKLNLQD